MTILGFTGTRAGMTAAQEKVLVKVLARLKPSEVHHGDCIGADLEFHLRAASLVPQPLIILHPPENGKQRSFCTADVVCEPLPYLQRNREIVQATNMLLATPGSEREVMRAGTWATIRYAREARKPSIVIYPSGKFYVEGRVDIDLNDL